MKKQKKEFEGNKLKTKAGITLIALVVTIVVLLILAGVSIAMLSGDNGIITKALEARTENAKQEIKEKILVDVIAAQMGNSGTSISEEDVKTIFGKYGEVLYNDDGTIKSLKPTGEDYEIPYEEIMDGYEVTTEEEEEEEEINLHLGGVYKGTATIVDESGAELTTMDMPIAFAEDGTAYMGNYIWNTGSIGKANCPQWNQKNENLVTYTKESFIINDSIEIQVSEDGTTFTVPKEVFAALTGTNVKENVTFTYTGGQFAEHEPYLNTKYYFVNAGFTKGDYLKLNEDGSFELSLSQYPEYSGVFEEGELDFNYSFSLDGKILNGNANFVNLLDVIAVEENSIIWNE